MNKNITPEERYISIITNKYNLSETFYIENICEQAVKIIEHFCIKNFATKPTKYFKDNPSYKYKWSILNNGRHEYMENPISSNQVINYLHYILDKIDTRNEIEIFNINIKDDIKWETIKEKRTYYGELAKINWINGKYYYSFNHKEYKQKNKQVLVSEMDLELSIGGIYEIEYITKKALNLEYIEKWICNINNKTKIINDDLNVIYQKYKIKNLNFLDSLIQSDNKKTKDDLIAWANTIDDIDILMREIFLLKYNLESRVKKNRKTCYQPWTWEFWTKNPRGGSFTLYEKNNIFQFLEKSRFSDRIKNNKYNYECYISMLKNNEYTFKNYDKSKTDNHFNKGYEEYKIIKMEDEYTINKYKLLYEATQELIKRATRFENVFPSININGLYPKQKKAFLNIIKNSFSVVNGFAGSGKTRMISMVIQQLLKYGENYIYLSPTHKALEVIDEMQSNKDVKSNDDICSSTIQKYISENKKEWSEDEKKYRDTKNIIIDEISMINDDDFTNLMKVLNNGDKKRFIFIGDAKQLPPIYSTGFSNIFFDLCKNITITLDENKRQDCKKIVNFIDIYRETEKLSNNTEIVESYDSTTDFIKLIKRYDDYTFITPIHNSLFGTKNISNIITKTSEIKKNDQVRISYENTKIHHVYKGADFNVVKIIEDEYWLKAKRKTMQKHLPYGPSEYGQWRILKDDKDESMENPYYIFTKIEDEELPFYKNKAITIHSSQGSTINKVCLIIPPGRILSSKFIYTAISRCRKKLKILIPSNNLDKYLIK